MRRKVILCADSTCDIGPELQSRYNVHFYNYHIRLGEKDYLDKEEITSEELFAAWRKQGLLPKTAAITPAEYIDLFRPFIESGAEIVHISLGSALTSSYQNLLIAANEVGHVYPVDSASLSTGSGHLVVQAGKMIEQGMDSASIQEKLLGMRTKVSASFVLDTLEFMAAGGRCSAVAAFGANLLKLKPCIKVNSDAAGKMTVHKKYRGPMEKVLVEYVRDQLQGRTDIDNDLCFITNACSPQSHIDLVKEEIAKYQTFKEICVTDASGTISSHCGPQTLGILFLCK